MHYEVFQIDGAIQLNIEGKLDATSGNAFQALVLKSLSKCRNLVIDFEKVTYMSSAGVRALVLGLKTAESKGGSLTVLSPQPQVKEVFKYSGLEKIMEIK